MTILCLIGASGSGKTSIANAMSHLGGIPTIVSYTTRPMREGETNGVEHRFVDDEYAVELLVNNRVLAYTKFGGYHYFAFFSQLVLSKGGIITYVIDESGYANLCQNIIDTNTMLESRGFINTSNLQIHQNINPLNQSNPSNSQTTQTIQSIQTHKNIQTPQTTQTLKLLNTSPTSTYPPIRTIPILISRDQHQINNTIDPSRVARDLQRTEKVHPSIIIHNDAKDHDALETWSAIFSEAIRVFLSVHQNPAFQRPIHLNTSMGVAEIIATINNAF